MTTAGDIWRMYVKPSLGGRVVFRKRTSIQTSARLKERQSALAALKMSPDAPATKCHKMLVDKGKCVEKEVHIPGKGKQKKMVCPISEMRSCLREEMKKVGRKA